MMFIKQRRPDVLLDFSGDPRRLAEAVRKGKKNFLRFSYLFAESEVDDLQDAYYTLLITGHELAHWINKHNEHVDAGPIDSQAIECFADFTGTILAILAATWCHEVSRILDDLFESHPYKDAPVDVRAVEVGLAIRRLYKEVYLKAGDDDRYPPPMFRRSTVMSTATHAFVRRFPHYQHEESWTYLNYYIMKAIENEDELDIIGLDEAAQEELIQRCARVHARLQGNDDAILSGLKEEFRRFIRFSYVSEEILDTVGLPPSPVDHIKDDREALLRMLELARVGR